MISFRKSLSCRFFTSTSQYYTQPLYATHPHLFKTPEELTPGISKQEYHERRSKLIKYIPGSSGMAIFKGNTLTYATQNIFNPFQQNTNFLYLTGIDEPDCILVLEKSSSITSMTKPYRMHLFVPPHLPSETRWTGPRLTVAQLKTQFCVDHVHCLTQYATFLKDMQSSVPTLDLTSQVEQLRVKKTKAEIQVLKKANRITHASFLSGLKNPWKKEHEGMAFLEYQMKSLGAQKLAYVPVVASGQRTCVLHYTQNDQQIHEGDLVLVDAGCQFGYYASDITRTFPASKHFTQPQRELYNAVLNTQEACLKHISPLISLDDLHTLSVMYLTEELNRLDFRTDKKTVSDHLYFHHLGHYLGLDVHDTPSVSRGIPLQSGMVITLEPGVYVPPSPMFPSKYHGIGIRIEDNVVIRSQGYDLLTNPIAPRTVDEIESLRC